MDKNLKHLLDISPYKAASRDPFNIWEKMDSKKSSKFLIIFYSKQSENWASMKEINKWLIKNIYSQDMDLIPYTIDINQPDITSLYQGVLDRCQAIVALSLNRACAQVIREVRERNKSAPLNIFHFSSSKAWGYQYKHFGLDIISKNDVFYCLSSADKKILGKVFPENPIKLFNPFPLTLNCKVTKEKRSLLYFGRISHEKNLHWVLESMAAYQNMHKTPPPHFHIFGEEDFIGRKNLTGEGSLREALQEQCEKLGISKQVSFYGYRPRKDIFKLIEQENPIGIFLSSYDTENYGLAPREALALGCPLILSRWGGFNDILDHDKDHSFTRGVSLSYSKSGAQLNPVEVAKKIRELENQPKQSSVQALGPSLPRLIVERTIFEGIDKKEFLKFQCLSDVEKSKRFFKEYSSGE